MFALILEYGIATRSWYAWLALRRRVSMSAIGSVMVIALSNLPAVVPPPGPSTKCLVAPLASSRRLDYQEAFDTPGSSPRCAISRMQIRHRPNLRYTALGRPQRWQRVYARTENFGFSAALRTSAFFAMSVLLEREAEKLQQRPALVIGLSGGHQGDVHAPRPIDPVLIDLVEDGLLGQAERVVAVAVEPAPVQATEVADTRQRDGQQPVQELPHPVAAQGHLRADRHALAQLELRDRLGRPAHLGLLAGDRGEVADRAVDQLRVPGSLTDTHVDDDLHKARHLHRVGVPVLRLELL